MATGQLAKTDRVDAALLVKMGALQELRADQPKSETLHDLKQLMTARLALIKDRTAAKVRLVATTHRMLSK
ncbi:MAG: transposase [Alteromonas macleodii]|jgi:transposase